MELVEIDSRPCHESKIPLLNLSLLKTHPAFRAVFIARFISILSLGLLGVAVPVQIQSMTHPAGWWGYPSP